MALPVPITGDFARSYNFFFLLCENAYNSLSDIKSIISETDGIVDSLESGVSSLFSSDVLEYVSSLANKVTVSPDSLRSKSLSILGIQYPEPESRDTGTITVSYYDDTDSSVYLFHKGWFHSIQDGAGFKTFQDVSLGMIVSPVIRESSGDTPTSYMVFPRVFPVSISRSPFDKGGDNLAMVDVQYMRIPVITTS